ncbi:hypothetical protein D7X99_26350 [Corallococcus sp. AB032C]|uniref:sensor histidine kinase n=1 Tax=Corallococcus TaxID=83461 RepID=UPI000ECCDA2C|nr:MULTISPECIES: histidine kinase [Corallococcus]NPC47928.1 histidine kinase [Corallococcus exiguus]RKH79065.1 hypothetical protein D7X99_26350 [Corallococcus sp. AB032C]
MAAGVLGALPHALRAYAVEPRDFLLKFALELVPYSAWALLGPLVLAVFQRVPLESPHVARRLGVLLVAGVGFVQLHVLLLSPVLAALQQWNAHGRSFPQGLWGLLLERGAVGFFEYLLFLAAWTALRTTRRLRERELAQSRLALQLAESRLQALRAQLDPHFLFNTLNAVTGLIRQQRNPEAVEALADLGHLLRVSLEGQGDHEVRLEDELELVRRFLGIEQLRFGPNLSIQFSPAPDTLKARVPALILQPLVENAIKHGIARSEAQGQVHVRSERRGDRLLLEVMNDGPGLRSGGVRGTGIGVNNTRARIQQLYGERYGLVLEDLPEGGVVARVELPFVESRHG